MAQSPSVDPAAAPARLPSGTVDVPVEFQVTNTNDTAVPCAADGQTYTVRGHLTAPIDQLHGGAITVYEHGIAAGEWYWRVPIDGYHHAYEMAERGHASLTIDRLGYDSSDAPGGNAMCVGSQATMAHHIVQDLRAGTYRWASPEPAPAFGQVSLAGQSNGGQIAQIEAYSFDDIDSLIVMDWADQGLTPEAYGRFFAAVGRCVAGGEPAEHNPAAGGYVYYDQGREEFVAGNFGNVDAAVLRFAAPQQNLHPCGDMMTQGPGILVDLAELGTITIPVLGMYGERDSRVQWGDEHMKMFHSSVRTDVFTLPAAGHYMSHSKNVADIYDRLDLWLDTI
ncbi:alpha/beta hydrolase [Nocardia tenerifensis]|uniref:alpha/beta hydrolase n=1 Tax=Nocardia tenerifensis TaxID=228006 RepID=UPI0002E42970|nr:alpha/beta hydrolase [Nocardia tenerifensis]